MPKRATANSLTIPPPILGINTKDPLSEMDPRYAVELQEMFPNAGTVDLRNGCRYHSKTIGTTFVDSLSVLEYNTTSKLMCTAVSDGKLYDASTASAAATDRSGGTAFSNEYLASVQFRDRLFLKSYGNGDDVYHYTGSGNMTASAFTGPGGDDKDLFTMGVYKSRLYFAELDAPSIWYGAVDAVTGALTEFPLTSVLTKGFINDTANERPGTLFLGPLTRAKQALEDDLFCIVMSTGEMLLYQGENPAHSTWALVGRYILPTPAGHRGFFYLGDSLCAICRGAIIPIRELMAGNQSSGLYPSISENIDSELTEDFDNSTFRQYFQGVVYPKGSYLIISIRSSGSAGHQWVMNLTTRAWTKFKYTNALSWVVYRDELYFGTNSGRLMKADNDNFDENPASEGDGLTRSIIVRPAYNYLGNREQVKQMLFCVPTIYQSEGLALTMEADMDFANVAATQTVTADTTDTAYKIYQPRVGLQGIGNAVSIRIDQTAPATDKRFSLNAIKVVWQDGDIT